MRIKCKECVFRSDGTRCICKNKDSDNYTDYVSQDLECNDGVKKEDE